MTKLKGTIARIEQGQIIEPVLSFSINPTKVSRSKAVKWIHHTAPGTSSSYAQFVSAGDQTIKLDILLASHRSNPRQYEKDFGVMPELAYYELLALPQADLFLNDSAQFIQPPTVIFGLNSRSWMCVVHSINIEELEYTDKLVPTMANVSITLKTMHDSFASLYNDIASLTSDRNLLVNTFRRE